MAVFRIERTRDYTVMSNHHLRNHELSLKAKGLLSMMLSLPDDWNYCSVSADIFGRGTRQFGCHLSGTDCNDCPDAFPVGQNEEPLSGTDCNYAGFVYPHVPHPEWNQRPLQSACFPDPLPVTEAELWIVYILSTRFGRSGRLYNESCFVCCSGADPAPLCPDRI